MSATGGWIFLARPGLCSALHPMAVLLVILLNLVVTLLFFQREDKHNFLFSPYAISQNEGYRGWIYAHFSHANWMHLLFNMITFYFFAPTIVHHMGPIFMLALYGVTGLASDLAVYAMRHKDPRYACLGASGSVSGILFGSIILEPFRDLGLVIIPFVPIPAPVFAIAYLALSFYMARRGGDGISHEAHIGGALAGLAVTAVMAPAGLQPLFAEIQRLLTF
ncbi:MAG: rhomboid family intramembrane serine protease [Leptonema illini]|uniref:Rhomboid family intramembrane serine protease n=1 Tax=Leptonema illini TaxID=183 RepID=A0A833H1N6_9LEPT|nr:MAG: rhomboid family intramembrane serine protease [Leptonema illini]